ncbi:MAG: preprotein translocase subunit SecG [Thiohalomonadaceae bacterium]
MQTVLLIVHMLVAVGLIGLVLLQQGKGADMGAAFGSGASSTVFGARGSASFLTRATGILATIFFVTSLSLAYFSGQNTARSSVVDLPAPQQQVPAAPQAPADVPAPRQ